MKWQRLGTYNTKSLIDTRLQCHHAVQLATRVTRGYLPSTDDDSHTNLGWDGEEGALASRTVRGKKGDFDLALRLKDLTIVWRQGGGRLSFPLSGRTLEEGVRWVRSELERIGLDTEPLDRPPHFQIPFHEVADGMRFSLGDGQSFEEMSRFYANAALAIGRVHAMHPNSSEPRCWPHHLDIATLIVLGGSGEDARTIGFGLSPGDENYREPYFYANPWPYPDASRLPQAPAGSRWHTEGWTGAILLAEELSNLSAAGQEARVSEFASDSISVLQRLLEE